MRLLGGNLDAPPICLSKLSTLRTWGVDPSGCEARSVAFSRARSVVSRWAAEARPDSSPAARRRDIRTGALPPRFDRNTLAKPLRTRAFPTLMSSYDQHVCIVGAGFNRYLSVAEVLGPRPPRLYTATAPTYGYAALH